MMDHAPTPSGTSARETLRAVLDELDHVQRVPKCSGCECFLGVLQSIEGQLDLIDPARASTSAAVLHAWFVRGARRRHGCLACAVCVPALPYNRFTALICS
jgi:tetrahydromethanopterin S-methyltransferase subunit A